MTDILLDNNDDLLIQNGDFVIEDSKWQEVGIIIRLNQGELKSDPVLGPSLIKKMKSNNSNLEIEEALRLHLKRDNKNYDELKNQIQLNI